MTAIGVIAIIGAAMAIPGISLVLAERYAQERRERDIEEMAAFAESLRRHGYLGVPFSADGIDRLLIRARSYKDMLALADKAVEVARKEGRS